MWLTDSQALWALIVDAKARHRHPDGACEVDRYCSASLVCVDLGDWMQWQSIWIAGRIVTAEEEEAERLATEEDMRAKTALWQERERHLAAGNLPYQ